MEIKIKKPVEVTKTVERTITFTLYFTKENDPTLYELDKLDREEWEQVIRALKDKQEASKDFISEVCNALSAKGCKNIGYASSDGDGYELFTWENEYGRWEARIHFQVLRNVQQRRQSSPPSPPEFAARKLIARSVQRNDEGKQDSSAERVIDECIEIMITNGAISTEQRQELIDRIKKI